MDFLYGRNKPFWYIFITLYISILHIFLKIHPLTKFAPPKKSPNVLPSRCSNPV